MAFLYCNIASTQKLKVVQHCTHFAIPEDIAGSKQQHIASCQCPARSPPRMTDFTQTA